jgi:WD40 repeat protein/energy-coupling factor transporter ATP-binding protein EcfA2
MPTSNPFPGLRPFEPDETHLFFGRDGQSEELIRRLGRSRFLAVVGTSGSGKSSLVRAGLLPALQGGLMASAGSDWRIAVFRPGHDPVGNLARALASTEVFGSVDPKRDPKEAETEAQMQTALTEATLRRSGLGLLEAVRQARSGASGPDGRPRLMPYENLLVVVDQFEELFRFRQLIEVENSKEDAAAFVRLLLEAARRPEEKIYVVLTMRSDFLGDCAQFQGLPEAINDGQYLIPRMTRDERREAVTGPVAVGGARITAPLVNQLLNDMGDNPDQLPILQHALMRTWDHWESVRLDGEPIDLPHYKAIGGMGEALSRHAEEAYGELGEAGREQSARQLIAEKLFKALAEKGANNQEVRRPVELREACEITGADEAEVASVVEVFRRAGRSFLMPPAGVPLDADSLIDISHESLIRNWTRLKKWTDDEAQSARIYRRLAETAVLHKAGEEALLKDPALQVALDWREKNRPNAAWARRYHSEFETAMSFLDASAEAREAELAEREKQRRREVSYKRTRLAAFLLALSFLLSLAASVYAYNQRTQALAALSRAEEAKRQAEGERAEATKARDEAQRRSVVASRDADLAREDKKKATERLGVAQISEAEAIRRAALARESEGRANAALKEAETQRAKAELQSAENAMVAAKNAEEAKQVRQLLYSAVINLAQQAYESNDLTRAREMLSLQTSSIGGRPGFEWFYLDHLLRAEKETLKPPAGGVEFIETSRDGKTLVIASGHTIELRDLTTGATKTISIELAEGEVFEIATLAVSPDGRRLAAGNAFDRWPYEKIYDAATGREVGELKAGRRRIMSMAFSPDGRTLITGWNVSEWYVSERRRASYGLISFWDAETLKPAGEMRVSYVTNFVVSPDGSTLAVANTSGITGEPPVEFWDLNTRGKLGELGKPGEHITAMAFSPNGRTFVTAGLGLKYWDVPQREGQYLRQGEAGGSVTYESDVFSLAYSPDGRLLAAGLADGTIRITGLSDVRDATLKGHREAVTSPLLLSRRQTPLQLRQPPPRTGWRHIRPQRRGYREGVGRGRADARPRPRARNQGQDLEPARVLARREDARGHGRRQASAI